MQLAYLIICSALLPSCSNSNSNLFIISATENHESTTDLLQLQEAMSRRLSDATAELSSNDDSSVDEKPKPRKKTESTAVKAKTAAPKIILHDVKWIDGSIPLAAVSDKLSKIGKVMRFHLLLQTISIY